MHIEADRMFPSFLKSMQVAGWSPPARFMFGRVTMRAEWPLHSPTLPIPTTRTQQTERVNGSTNNNSTIPTITASDMESIQDTTRTETEQLVSNDTHMQRTCILQGGEYACLRERSRIAFAIMIDIESCLLAIV